MNKVFLILQRINRENAKDSGFYDGRFRSRLVDSKKKTLYLKLRKNKNHEETKI
jgi:hypothetical protein